MKVTIQGTECKVTREAGDPKLRNGGWGTADSRFFYLLKKVLNARGFDLVKKQMCRDGHMISEGQFYLRARKYVKNPRHNIAILDHRYCLRSVAEDFNKGDVVLFVVRKFWLSRV